MYQVSYMLNDRATHGFTIYQNKTTALAAGTAMAIGKDVYCWSVSKIIEASEPHWTEEDFDNE